MRGWLLGLALVVACVLWALATADPVAALRARAVRVVQVIRVPAPQEGEGIERWWLITARGDSLGALWRAAPDTTERPWTLVMLGGLHTGDRSLHAVPREAPVHVLAMDWPWRGPRRMSTARFVVALPGIRDALLRTPAVLAAGLDAARTRADVTPERIALVGVSLGAPPALAALRLGSGAKALVLVDGCADLEGLMARELRTRVRPRGLAGMLAAIGGRLIAPLEPELHADAARRLPVLLCNARRDERLPRSGIARLHRALPAAEIRWRDTEHARPGDAATLDGVVEEGVAWLASLP